MTLILNLTSDLSDATKLWHAEPESQFAGRTYIRTFWSSCDGILFTVRRTILLLHDLGINKLTDVELLTLREQTFKLTEKGNVEIRDGNYIPAKTAFRFTISMLEKTYGKPYLLDLQSSGYHAFLQTLSVRNRITHPKSATEFLISQDDVRNACRAAEWFSIQSEQIPATFTAEQAIQLIDQTGLYSKKNP